MTTEEAIAYGEDYYRDLITAVCDIGEKHKAFVKMSVEALKERKTGKWIVQPSLFYKNTTVYICPFCKSQYEQNSWAAPKFCQNCGMKSIGIDETHKYAGWKKIYEDYPNES